LIRLFVSADKKIPLIRENIKTRLIVSNGFLNMLTLFNTFLLRLSRIVKMMMMDLN